MRFSRRFSEVRTFVKYIYAMEIWYKKPKYLKMGSDINGTVQI